LANAQATYASLADFGVALESVRPEEFADRSSFFRFGRDPRSFDILPDLPGVDFDAAWERRIEGVIDAQSGFKAFFISKDDLIAASWRRAGRKTLQTLAPCKKPRRAKARGALTTRAPHDGEQP
jgi:hypothetical protein